MAGYKVKLEICGSSYVVSTSDPEEYIQGLAERLDQDMNQMMIDTPNASVTAAAVITALSYLDEAEKSAQGADNMRSQIQGYLEDAAKARMAAEEAKREADLLRNQLAHYEKQAAPKKQGEGSLLDYGQNEMTKPAPAASPSAPLSRYPDQHEGQVGIDDLED